MPVLYLRSTPADISLGTNNTNKAGAAVAWRSRRLDMAPGLAAVQATIATVAGPTNGIETGTPVNEWISDPVAATANISNILASMYAFESNAMANAGIGVVLERISNTGAISLIADLPNISTPELSTTVTNLVWSITLNTPFTLNTGDRLRVRVYFDDGGGTMASGYTCTLQYDGPFQSNAESQINISEPISFMAAPESLAPSQFSSITFYPGSVAYGNGVWMATGGTSTHQRTTSLESWTAYSIAGIQNTFFVSYGLEPNSVHRWMISATQSILHSTNAGTSWSLVPGTYPTGILYTAYGNGVWAFASNNSSPVHPIYVCTDIATGFVSTAYTPPNGARGLYFVGGQWVLYGDGGLLATATNPGGTWTQVTPFTSTSIESVRYGNGQWVAIALGGRIYTAPSVLGPWTENATTTAFSGTGYALAYLPINDTWYAAGSKTFPSLGSIRYTKDPTGAWNELTPSDEPYSTAAASDNAVHFGSIGFNSRYTVFGTRSYLTSTASDIGDQGASVTELSTWTSRGNG